MSPYKHGGDCLLSYLHLWTIKLRMTVTPTRILVADHQVTFAELLAERIDSQPRMECVGRVFHASGCAGRIVKSRAEIVVISTSLLSGHEVSHVQEAVAAGWDGKVVLLAEAATHADFLQASRGDFDGFVSKQDSTAFLIRALRRVAKGEIVVSPKLERRYEGYQQNGHPTLQAMAILTPRQIEVLIHLARGGSVKDVVATLGLSDKSIDSHKYRIMSRLGIHNRVQLALFAVRAGLIEA